MGVLVGCMRSFSNWKCSILIWDDNKVYSQPNYQQKCRNFCIFSIFFWVFFKIKFKNYVCFNLTAKTSEYKLDVSQFSDQCFCDFLLRLLSNKIKALLSEIFSHGSSKNHISSLGSKSQKVPNIKFCFCIS